MWLLISLGFMASAWAQGTGAVTYGNLYRNDLQSDMPAVHFERRVIQTPLGKTVFGRWQSPDGKELTTESVEYIGSEMRRYTLKQKQISEWGTAEVRGKKIFFEWRKMEDGKEKVEKGDEDLHEDTVVVEQMIDLLRERWDTLMKGDDVNVRFVVLSRRETVGFKIYKDREIDYEGTPAVVLKMKPQNIFIALFVNPLYLTFAKDGDHRILEVDGRMPVKKFKDGDYSDIEGILRFDEAPPASFSSLAPVSR